MFPVVSPPQASRCQQSISQAVPSRGLLDNSGTKFPSCAKLQTFTSMTGGLPTNKLLVNSFEYLDTFYCVSAISEYGSPCECNFGFVFGKYTVNNDIIVFGNSGFDTLNSLSMFQIGHSIMKKSSPNVDFYGRSIDHIGGLGNNETLYANGNSVPSMNDSMDRPCLACRVTKWPWNT